jgi:hypothetical protein
MLQSNQKFRFFGGLFFVVVILSACVSQGSFNGDAVVATSAGTEEFSNVTPTHTRVENASQSIVPGLTVPVAGTLTPMPTPEMEVSNVDPRVTVPAELQGFADQAKADLEARLGIDVTQIELLEAIEVVWPDASMGCPQPGMAYIQVPQDGVLIRLAAEGREYAYHGGGSGELFLCEQTLKTPKPAPPKLDDFLPPINPKTD